MIYFALAVGSRTVKIGHTSGRAEDRLAALSTGCPHDLVLLDSCWGDAKQEAELHDIYGDLHHKGEWFRLEGTLLEHMTGRVLSRITTADFPEQGRPSSINLQLLDILAEELGKGDEVAGWLWRAAGERSLLDGGAHWVAFTFTNEPCDPMDLPSVHAQLKAMGFYRLFDLRPAWAVPAFIPEQERKWLLERLNG